MAHGLNLRQTGSQSGMEIGVCRPGLRTTHHRDSFVPVVLNRLLAIETRI